MIPRECKRLAEVDFPVARVSKHAAREKSLRHAHPSTIHLWWARRPLAACRAMLLAMLWPDPCDPRCPQSFKERARQLLPQVQGTVGPSDQDLREALLDFIGDYSSWDLSSSPRYNDVSRSIVKAAYGEEPPLVVDPFAGGGSIPLEALRVGCETFASDLNPVARLILRVMLRDLPRRGPTLAEELQRLGAQIRDEAAAALAEYYPDDSDGSSPFAYLWARTVRCESPNCGAEIPLVKSFWLCSKGNRKRALRYHVKRAADSPPEIEFEIFEPELDSDVPGGTVKRAKAACPACHTVLQPERVRAQLTAQRGGADAIFNAVGQRIGGARLLAVVTLKQGEQGRKYRLALESDYAAVCKAKDELAEIADEKLPNGLRRVPDEEIPRTELRRISLPLYGVARFRDMFSARQLITLSWLARRIGQLGTSDEVENRLLSLCLGKTADLNNANTPWKPDAECPVHTLARHDLPAAWDFAEACLLGAASGSFMSAYERTAASVRVSYIDSATTATVERADACSHPLPDHSASVWFTDPPYYDSVPYAHLSDFFYIWEKRALTTSAGVDRGLTPKNEECVVDRPHSAVPDAKTAAQFEGRIGEAMGQGARVTQDDGIACVVFAHKTTEGWEALLSGMIQGGWVITGSWPIVTEMQSRLNARDNASLAASVHLICRPRAQDTIGEWTRVIRDLPKRVADWLPRLQAEGIRGADLVFACIGPALEIYSAYSKVVDAEDREIPLGGNPEASEPHLRGYLAYVWEVVGRTALEQVLGADQRNGRDGAAGTLEEDARLTALFLWTLQTTSTENIENDDEDSDDDARATDEDGDESSDRKKPGFTLIFDVARRFAQPLGIHLETWEGRIVETKKGIVRLLPIRERAQVLFGEAGADIAADRIESAPAGAVQLDLFAGLETEAAAPPTIRGRGRKRQARQVPDDSLETRQEATTLDRVHAAMLLQASGRSNALRALLAAEVGRSPDFLRLANALAVLYPKDSEEKRLVEAMLLAVPK